MSKFEDKLKEILISYKIDTGNEYYGECTLTEKDIEVLISEIIKLIDDEVIGEDDKPSTFIVSEELSYKDHTPKDYHRNSLRQEMRQKLFGKEGKMENRQEEIRKIANKLNEMGYACCRCMNCKTCKMAADIYDGKIIMPVNE